MVLIHEESDAMVGERRRGREVSKLLGELGMLKCKNEVLECGDQERVFKLNDLESNILTECRNICCSKLTDWQKIDVLNCFVLSKTNYLLRLSLLNASWCQRIDGKIRKMVKHIEEPPGLPARTENQKGIGDLICLTTSNPASQSSPDPDGITYNMPRASQLLSHIYICIACNRIPTIGNAVIPSLSIRRGYISKNLRQISIQQTVYKIFAAIFAKSQAEWSMNNGILLPLTKRFLPFEHNTIRMLKGESKTYI